MGLRDCLVPACGWRSTFFGNNDPETRNQMMHKLFTVKKFTHLYKVIGLTLNRNKCVL